MEELLYSTVTLKSDFNRNALHDGTGFFMQFPLADGSNAVALVTTKTILAGVDGLTILGQHPKGNEPSGDIELLTVGVAPELIVDHPSKDVDLCAVMFEPLLAQNGYKTSPLLLRPLDVALVPSDAEFKAFDAIEDILMLSGSRSLIDLETGHPLTLKGTTATGLAKNYRHRTEFLADIAVDPGALGSPVFLHNPHGYFDPRGQVYVAEPKLKLVGILTGGAYLDEEGLLVTGC